MQGDITRSPLMRTMASALAGLSAAVAVHAQNRIVYVDASAPAGGNGQSWQTAYNDLQVALLLVARTNRPNSATEFRVAAGVYQPDLGTGIRNFAFFVEEGDRLIGGYAGFSSVDPEECDPSRYRSILNGDLLKNDGENWTNRDDNSPTCVRIERRTMSIASAQSLPTIFRGLTWTGFESLYQGADLASLAGSCFFTQCEVKKNRYRYFTYNASSLLVMNASRVIDNQVAGSVLTSFTSITRSEVRGNVSAGGGYVIHAAETTPPLRLSRNLITDNLGFISAVGMFNATTIVNCTIAGNQLTSAGIFSSSGDDAIRIGNSIVSNALPIGGAQVRLSRCDIATFAGPNLLKGGLGGVLIVGGSTCAFQTPPLDASMLFVDADGPDNNPSTWVDNDYRPRQDSPAIDRANLTLNFLLPTDVADVHYSPPFDLLTAANTGSGTPNFVDVGAFEYTPDQTPSSCPADFNRSGAVTVQDVFDYLTAYFGGCM